MKTLTMLAAGAAAMGTVAATAQSLQHDAMRHAEQAHAAAAELVAITAPHAHCTPAWDRLTRQAVGADNAAAAVQAALAVCDFCTARDAADRLSEIADDLQDDAEELEPVATPFGRRQARQQLRRLEDIADALEEISDDLRRETRRLDRRQDDRFRTGPPSVFPTPIPAGPPLTTYPVGPGPAYGDYTLPYAVPQGVAPLSGDAPGLYDRRVEYPNGGPTPARPAPAGSLGPATRGGVTSGGGLGPSLNTPPADAFGPTPSAGTNGAAPSDSSDYYYGVAPTGGSEPQPLPPGQSQKIQQRQPGNGPALLGPSAQRDDRDRL